jgi:predicted RNA binding protein YcfA (HicA-like mRNA interferase family)
MPKWRSLKPKDLIKALRRAGFIEKRQRGSHLIMSNEAGRIVVVPMHHGKDIPVGTLHAILRDANLTPEQLENLL